MATSLSCRVSTISAFCWPTTQTTSITSCLVAIVHTKPVIAILVQKLVSMATSFSTCGLPCNTWFLGPIRVHNQKGASIGSAVCGHMTVECVPILYSVPILYNGTPLFQKLPLPMGNLDPHLIYGSLGQPEYLIQMTSRSVQPFLQGSLPH